MDPNGGIYALTDEQRAAMERSFTEQLDDEQREVAAEAREDVARLDGYLKARAEADAPNRAARRAAEKMARRR